MKLDKINPAKLLNNLQIGVVVHSSTTQILYANPKALELLRLTADQVLGKDAFDSEWQFLDHHRRPMLVDQYPVNRVLSYGKALTNLEVGISDSTSSAITWVQCNAYPEYNDDGEIELVIVNFADITRQKEEIPFKEIVENTSDVVIVTESEKILGDSPKILYVNKAFTELSEFTAEEAIGKTPRILQGKSTSIETRSKIRQALVDNRSMNCQILNFSKSGRPYWLDLNIFPLKNAFGEVTFFAAIERDISHLVYKQQQLIALSEKDPLTNLLNRRGFENRTHILKTVGESNTLVIAALDIDHFKEVNDTYGHEAGDNVLKVFADNMLSEFRASDIIARVGGEEFLVVLTDINSNQAFDILERFRERIADFNIVLNDEQSIKITVSIGIAQATSKDEIERVIKLADNALYKSKKQGRNRITIADIDKTTKPSTE